jgi:hypothetical protein
MASSFEDAPWRKGYIPGVTPFEERGMIATCFSFSIYYPPPGLIVGGSNIRHRLIPHITLLRARDYALTAFLIRK